MRGYLRFLLTSIAGLVLLFTKVTAAAPDTVLVGKAARITTDAAWASTTLTGTIVGIDSLGVSLTRPGDSLEIREIPFDHISRLELKEGRRGNFWTGALIGALVGGGGMALIAAGDGDAGEFGSLVALVIGAGAGGGALIGGVIGTQVKSPGWKEVPRERLWSMGIAPYRDGVQVALRLGL